MFEGKVLEKSISRYVYNTYVFLTKILTRTCFCLGFEWINIKWTVSRHLNDHSGPQNLATLSDVPIPVNSDKWFIYTTPKYGRFSMLKLVQNFFHDQHLNHIQFYDVEPCFQKWRQNLPEKYPSMDVKDPPLPPGERLTPSFAPPTHSTPWLRSPGPRQKNHRMVTRWPSPLVSN